MEQPWKEHGRSGLQDNGPNNPNVDEVLVNFIRWSTECFPLSPQLSTGYGLGTYLP